MKRLYWAGCLFVLSFALFSSLSLARDISVYSIPELDQALEELEELEDVVVKSKPLSSIPTPVARQDLNLELIRHPEDADNPHLNVYATLTDGTPLQLVAGPEYSGNWEFEVPWWAIRWVGTPHNDINDNILDIIIHISNPEMLGRNRFSRHFGWFQREVIFSLRIYFDEEEASTNSWVVRDVSMSHGFQGGNNILSVGLRSHTATEFFSTPSDATGEIAAFSATGIDEPDSNNLLPLLLIPTMLITAQQNPPLMQTVYSSTAASPF